MAQACFRCRINALEFRRAVAHFLITDIPLPAANQANSSFICSSTGKRQSPGPGVKIVKRA